MTNYLALQDFDARPDIRKFLQSHLSSIYERNHQNMTTVSLPWPSVPDLDALVEKCDGSFNSAVNMVQFIGGNGFPHERLPLALAPGFQVLDGDDGGSVRQNDDGVNAERSWCCRIM